MVAHRAKSYSCSCQGSIGKHHPRKAYIVGKSIKSFVNSVIGNSAAITNPINKSLWKSSPQDSIGDLTLKNEMLQLAGVQAVTRMGEISGKMVWTSGFWYEGGQLTGFTISIPVKKSFIRSLKHGVL